MKPFSLWNLLTFCALLTIGSAAAGFGIGDAIGRYLPEYYRPFQNPVLAGRFEGSVAGLGLGFSISMVLVVLAVWMTHRSRLHDELNSLAAQVERLEHAVTRLYEELHKPR